MYVVLIILLVLLLAGVLPVWPYSQAWGHYPSSGVFLVILILMILLFTGHL